MRNVRNNRGLGNIIHLHWLTNFFSKSKNQAKNPWRRRYENLLFALANIKQLLILKSNNYKLVWTVHNTVAHETRINIPERLVRWSMTYLCNDIIVMSDFSRDEFSRIYGRRHRVHVIPHGNYIDAYPNTISREDARERLGISPQQKILLHLGMLRPYKGIDDLLTAFAKVTNDNAVLLIAGACWDQPLRNDIE